MFWGHILSEGQVWADFGQGPGDTRGARPTSISVLMELPVLWARPTEIMENGVSGGLEVRVMGCEEPSIAGERVRGE